MCFISSKIKAFLEKEEVEAPLTLMFYHVRWVRPNYSLEALVSIMVSVFFPVKL